MHLHATHARRTHALQLRVLNCALHRKIRNRDRSVPMFHVFDSSSRAAVCFLALAMVAHVPMSAQGKTDAQHQQSVLQKSDFVQKPASASKPDFARFLARPDGSMPLILDWSNQHVIYTAGYTAEQADRMAKDPRALASFLSHGMMRTARFAGATPDASRPTQIAADPAVQGHGNLRPPTRGGRGEPAAPMHITSSGTLHRDWAVSLGDGLQQSSYAIFPAKYTFDVNAAPSCANDFVVFPIPATTGGSRAKVAGTFIDDPTSGQTTSVTITPSGSSTVTLTLTAGATNAGTTFAISGTNNTTTDAANLAATINRNLSSIGLDEVAAVASSGTVTVYALTAGTGVALSTANGLSNFSWGSVSAGTNGSQANIVGLNNLYAGSGSPFCSGYTYPTFTFSYAAGVGGVSTSPTLSLDGRKVAFVENDATLGAILHLLTLGTDAEFGSCTNNGTSAPTCATAAVIPGSTSGSNAADYMLPLALAGGLSAPTHDAYSSPFVVYSTDILYVGDGNGNLFSVSPVFEGGTPALRSGFPVAILGGDSLQSPIVDVGNTGNVYVKDNLLTRLYNVTSSGVVEGYITLGSGEVARDDAPLVDSTNGLGYAVADCNESPSTAGVVVQFLIAATGNPGVLATAPLSSSSCEDYPVYNAAPDNNYFTEGISSSTPGSNGELLVAYNNSPGGRLAQFQFTSGIMNTTAEYTDSNGLGTDGYFFSPMTEFYGNDQAYTIGTLTQTGNTVTVTTATNAFISNQVVVISGVGLGTGGCTSAAANAMDGEQTVAVTSPTTFTFTSAVNTTIGGANGNCTITSALATGPTQDNLFFASTQPEMFAFDVPLTSAAQAAAATNNTSVATGTGGMIVDNDSSDGQASSVYFVTGSTSSCAGEACAVKLTQAGLN
jgi:hypothetical protein